MLMNIPDWAELLAFILGAVILILAALALCRAVDRRIKAALGFYSPAPEPLTDSEIAAFEAAWKDGTK